MSAPDTPDTLDIPGTAPVWQTAVCSIDGTRGELRYRGYDIRELVSETRFADVAQLLWLGRWPTTAEGERFEATARARIDLPPATRTMLGGLPRATHPLAAVRTALSLEGTLDATAEDVSAGALGDKAATLYARAAAVVGALACRLRGEAPRPPRPELDRGANLLWMATGREPGAVARQALDALLITFAEHELNPSTFAARIVAGTGGDYWSAIIAALGAFSGPRHGGVFGSSLPVLLELGSPAAVPAYVEAVTAGQGDVPGFGRHHVYEGRDPRVAGLADSARRLAHASGEQRLFETARALERRLKSRHGLSPSADYYGALVMHLLGFSRELFPALLVTGRFAGWTAHIVEQYAAGTPFRPRAAYVGPGPRALESDH